MGAARSYLARMAARALGLAGQVPPDSVGVWRHRETADSRGTRPHFGARRRAGKKRKARSRQVRRRHERGGIFPLAYKQKLDARLLPHLRSKPKGRNRHHELALQWLGEVR